MSRRRKILIVAVIVLGVAIFIPVIRHYQLRFAVANYVAGLKAKGEPMELAQVIPPPVPPEQNGVPLITNALADFWGGIFSSNLIHNLPPAMREVSPGKAMIGWQQPKIIGSDEPSELLTNTWEDLGKELAAAKSDLDSFQNLTNHQLLDFNLDYQQGFNIRLAHLAQLKRAEQWLNASTLCNLHQGNMSSAFANVRIMLDIVKGQTKEPLNISQLVRMAFAQMSADATWEILQNTNASEDDLAMLQQNWQSLEFIRPTERVYLMERAMVINSLEQFRRQPNDLWRGISGDPDGIQRMWHKSQWRWFWSYSDEQLALQIYQVLINATRLAETNRSFQSAQSFTSAGFTQLGLEKPQAQDDVFRMDIDDFGMRSLCSEDAHDSFVVLRKAMAMETARNVVVTAIAIKRYGLRHHQLPVTLDELTPDLLQTIPIDWMDGQPLRYRPNAGGNFLLYSIGENGVDDGGNASLKKHVGETSWYWQNPYALDRVWPQPATEAEIQAYYKKLSSKSN